MWEMSAQTTLAGHLVPVGKSKPAKQQKRQQKMTLTEFLAFNPTKSDLEQVWLTLVAFDWDAIEFVSVLKEMD